MKKSFKDKNKEKYNFYQIKNYLISVYCTMYIHSLILFIFNKTFFLITNCNMECNYITNLPTFEIFNLIFFKS